MAIITAAQFREKAYSVIEIPGFMPGETFEIKVKNLSIVGLMSSGKIPNSLMTTVKEAFEGLKSKKSEKSSEENNANVIDKAKEITELLDIVCQEAMVEPRFNEIKDVMNDSQKLAIFEYTQGGVEHVKSFPEVSGDSGRADDVENLSDTTE